MKNSLQSAFGVAALAVALAALSCGRGEKTQSAEEKPEATPFQKAAMFGSVIPLASGSAYLFNDNHVYLLAGGRAQRVADLPEGDIEDIVALADGSAIATSDFTDHPRLFWLRDARAIEILEGQAMTRPLAPSSTVQGFFLAEAQRLRAELSEARDEIALLEEPPDLEPYEEQEYP